jgi:hypothetical protein
MRGRRERPTAPRTIRFLLRAGLATGAAFTDDALQRGSKDSTQVVWRESVRLGCGTASCNDGGVIWVCNYDPPGNYLGNMPY